MTFERDPAGSPAASPDRDDVDPLTQLAIKHGTDKWGPHFYTPTYHALFAHLRETPVRLLEIGIGGYGMSKAGGSSLSMWAEYFPNGQIVGIDIAEKKLALGPRIHLRQGSQDDPAFLHKIADEHGPFDIVIDDGSHVPQHIVASFGALFSRLRDRGLYVIEDVQTCFWPQFGGAPDGSATFRLAAAILQGLHHAEIKIGSPEWRPLAMAELIRAFRAFHNLFVIEKGDNTEPSIADYKPDSAHATRALRTIERQMQQSPTAAGYANLITVLALSNKLSQALATADEALGRWPDHPDLLVVAFSAANQRGDAERKLRYIRRLIAVDPDDAKLPNILKLCEAEASAKAAS